MIRPISEERRKSEVKTKQRRTIAYGEEKQVGTGLVPVRMRIAMMNKEERVIKQKNKEEAKMNTLRKLMAVVMVLGMVGVAGKVFAASTSTVVLKMYVAANYSVQITSATDGAEYNFGTLDVGMTTRTERPAVVTNNGNLVSEWQISALTIEGVWTLGANVGAENDAVLKALFNHKDGDVPEDGDYETVVGSTLTAAALHTDTAQTAVSTTVGILQNIAKDAQRDLFFMMHTPTSVSVAGTGDQRFRVYVTAVAPQ